MHHAPSAPCHEIRHQSDEPETSPARYLRLSFSIAVKSAFASARRCTHRGRRRGEGPRSCAGSDERGDETADRAGIARARGRVHDDDLHPCPQSRWAGRPESRRPALSDAGPDDGRDRCSDAASSSSSDEPANCRPSPVVVARHRSGPARQPGCRRCGYALFTPPTSSDRLSHFVMLNCGLLVRSERQSDGVATVYDRAHEGSVCLPDVRAGGAGSDP